jgi:hypothetical protein
MLRQMRASMSIANAPGNDQNCHCRPDRSGHSGDCGDEQRTRDGTDLIK